MENVVLEDRSEKIVEGDLLYLEVVMEFESDVVLEDVNMKIDEFVVLRIE